MSHVQAYDPEGKLLGLASSSSWTPAERLTTRWWTAVWGDPDTDPSINVVFVSKDGEKTDPYGQQIERHNTSIVDESSQGAHGMFWRRKA